MKLLKLLGGTALGVGLLASAHAADTSCSVVVRNVIENGDVPTSAYVHVNATAASVANGFTFDLPVPEGMTSANIVGFMPNAVNSAGAAKPLAITRSGNVVTVSGSNITSGTTAVGDMVRGIVLYE